MALDLQSGDILRQCAKRRCAQDYLRALRDDWPGGFQRAKLMSSSSIYRSHWLERNAMPANLTHQYRKAEEDYRRATTSAEELLCLQVMLRELPKHKGTDKLHADLKQKISQAKRDCDSQKAEKKGQSFRILRQGAGRVVLLGGPNTGKSQFVRAVTRARPEVAEYPFTTREPIPAMMPWQDVLIQLIDAPPITRDVLNPNLQGLVRGADLALLFVDLGSDDGIAHVIDVVNRFAETKTRLGRASYLDENDVGLSFTCTLLVPNKIDLDDAALRLERMHEETEFDVEEYVISATVGTGIDALKNEIFQALDVVRVYTKLPTAKAPDYKKPFTVRRGGTLGDVAALVHHDFAENLKFARVWGSRVHDGTTVKADYVVSDKDVVELHVG